MLDEIRLRGDHAEVRDEITELARRYGIVTPYTAYLILEDEARRSVPVALQVLPGLRDGIVRERMSTLYRGLPEQKVGRAAEMASSYNLYLKQAENVDALREGQDRSLHRYGQAPGPVPRGAPAPIATAEVVTGAKTLSDIKQQTQNMRYVKGRAFYQNGVQWVDGEISKKSDARRLRIQFNTPEYFNLLSQTNLQSWLAVGKNVQFLSGDTLYEIYE